MQKRSFRKILIANRGEIALRIIRTCRAMGLSIVAVYSDADLNAPHTRLADEAVHIGPAQSSESYLKIGNIVEAAQRTGADAIHPGYGFLSEKAEFAEACAAAGIVFIGPSAEAIRQMGSKSKARSLAAEAGVAVVPGFDGEDQQMLGAQILKLGFPVLIKASAGGGGKGIRVVRSEDEIEGSIEAARREAEKAFADSSLLLEKFIERARHIEVQILGDNYGKLVHLFERDCSVQRRHQKIIEESPSVGVSDQLRQALGDAALRVGRALGYTNAGTVEFILAPTGEFYFIEVNTRLQVEHPVTEMITGLDLVQLQIEVAEGKPLQLRQDELRTVGHAIEARLYAEDPSNNFLPSTGKIYDWHLTEVIEGVRIDSGVERGTEVGIYYDPLLAKLIAQGADRDEAVRKLIRALRALSVQGLQTNRDLLIRLLEHREFLEGQAHTGFIAEHLDELVSSEDRQLDQVSLAAVALYAQERWRYSNSLLSELPPNYRNNPYRDPSIRLKIGGREVVVSWRNVVNEIYEVNIFDFSIEVQVISSELGNIRLSLDGIQRSFRIVEKGDQISVHSWLGSRLVERLPRHPIRDAVSDQGTADSPMPGQVLKVLVEDGQRVSVGDPLIILEAMKMEHTLHAKVDGVVELILVKQGEVVAPGQILVQIATS
jgi:acetyl-CoA carboxylase biotin carboxylase subunit